MMFAKLGILRGALSRSEEERPMNCPVCGYARSAFDTHCPRCRQMAAQGSGRRVVNPAEQTVIVPELSGRAYQDTPRGLNLWAVALLVCLALIVGILIGRLTAPQLYHSPFSSINEAQSRPK